MTTLGSIDEAALKKCGEEMERLGSGELRNVERFVEGVWDDIMEGMTASFFSSSQPYWHGP